MEQPDVPQDDLMDVAEMMTKLEDFISDTLEGNATNLGMSALMSATINCMMRQCRTVHEARMYRQIYMQIFDHAISSIRIEEKD